MPQKINLSVRGVKIDLSTPRIARITLDSDNSQIEIPRAYQGDTLIGTVPHDASGHWATLRDKMCSFTEDPVPNWW